MQASSPDRLIKKIIFFSQYFFRNVFYSIKSSLYRSNTPFYCAFFLHFFMLEHVIKSCSTNKKLIVATSPPKNSTFPAIFIKFCPKESWWEWPETRSFVKNSTFPSISFKFHKSGDRISSPCFVGTKLGDEILPPLLCFKIDQNRPKSTKSGDGTLPPRLPESRCMRCAIFHRHFWKVAMKLVGTVSSPLLKWRWKTTLHTNRSKRAIWTTKVATEIFFQWEQNCRHF